MYTRCSGNLCCIINYIHYYHIAVIFMFLLFKLFDMDVLYVYIV